MSLLRIIFLSIFFLLPFLLKSQETARIIGSVRDSVTAEEMPFVSVVVVVDKLQLSVVKTDVNGNYDISVPAELKFDLVFIATGYPARSIEGMRLSPNDVIELDIQLSSILTTEVIVTAFEEKEADALRISNDDIKNLPTTTMNLESMLQFMAVGVTAGPGGELTSQY